MRRLAFALLILTMACWDNNQARWIARSNMCRARGLGWHYMSRKFMAGSQDNEDWYCVRIDSVLVRADSVTLP